MKKYITLLFWLISIQAFSQIYQSPGQLYPGLFEKIQLSGIYPDSKTFVDAVPKKTPKEIMSNYDQVKNKQNFVLKDFVEQNFQAPENHNALYTSDIKAGLEKHLDTLWTVLSRNPDTAKNTGSSLIALPNPYIVPGGRFREIYYWDSYFTMLGLKEAGKVDMIKNMVDNFSYLIHHYGFIPNGNRTYYLTRSQPPFFSLMVNLLSTSDTSVKIKDYRDVLELEYRFWMKGSNGVQRGKAIDHVVKLHDGSLLNRYWDSGDYPREESYVEDLKSAEKTKQHKPDFYRHVRSAAESGWDFSTRWFADGDDFGQIITTDLIPVDLNTLLYKLEDMISIAYKQEGNLQKAKLFKEKAEKRKLALLKYCWNPTLGFFVDYNWKKNKQSSQLTLAGIMPLFFNLASKAQAKAVAYKLEKQFLAKGGLVTTLKKSGQQWDSPNAWAPLQWVSYMGLRNYGYYALSDNIANRWINFNTKVFDQTGKLMEKYDVTQTESLGGGGEYPLQDGFGWTNGVLLKLLRLKGKE